ncbi:MAG: TonB-dependent receptor [Bacteroidales bacterium]|nr:TonB-dependent receptor [Bacteroidales bacterium]
MRKLLHLSLLIMAMIPFSLRGQNSDILFRGDFQDVPFGEFVNDVEQQTGVRFYFLENWIRGVRVTASGEEISLRRTLDRTLLPAGLYYHVEGEKQIYLSNQQVFVHRLPEYSGSAGKVDQMKEGEGAGLTSTEQRYIDGRKAGMLQTITVGSREEGGGKNVAVLHGKITDVETGDPLVGATLYFEELKRGTATDVDGRFNMVVRPGKYSVEFKCMGMEDRNNYLEVLSDGDLAITMEKSVIALTEVVVQANRYHNVRGTQMGFDRLNYKVLKEVPVVMGEKDILKVIQMLPGVQTVGEGAAGFNVRGSAADQNMIYVNKVPVYNSSHLFGFFTSFSPDIVKDFTLYKSNLPASYGGRLASFFDLTARQGNLNKYTARGGISPVTARLSVEGPIQKGKSSFILAGRSTYSDWILDKLQDPQLRESKASFNDLSGMLTWEPGEKTLVKAFGYFSHDFFRLGSTNQYEYNNAGGSLNIRRRIGSRLTGDLALVYGAYDFSTIDEQVASEAWTQSYRIDHYETKIDLAWLSLGKHKLTFGGNAILYRLNRGKVLPYGDISMRVPVELGLDNGVETAVYLADEISLTPRLTLYGGLRFATFLSLGPGEVRVYGEGQALQPGSVVDVFDSRPFEVLKAYTGLEPRLAVNFMLGANNSLKFSYNRVNQFLFMLSNTVAISPTDQWKLCDYNISPPFVDQLSLGFYQDFPKGGLNTSLEVYYKKIHDVVDYRDGASFISTPHVETVTLQGEQDAYGFEALFRKNAGKLSGWVAYSYSRSIMEVDSPIPSERINLGEPYPSNFDRPHNLSVVSNVKLNRRLSFSANMVYTTGRPVTYPVSIYYIDGMQFVDYASRNSYRIPDYFRVDLSINLEGNLKERKLFHSYWMLNFYNVTGRRNAYSVYFQNDGGSINGYKLSIFGQTVITLSWNFKLGNYASE